MFKKLLSFVFIALAFAVTNIADHQKLSDISLTELSLVESLVVEAHAGKGGCSYSSHTDGTTKAQCSYACKNKGDEESCEAAIYQNAQPNNQANCFCVWN